MVNFNPDNKAIEIALEILRGAINADSSFVQNAIEFLEAIPKDIYPWVGCIFVRDEEKARINDTKYNAEISNTSYTLKMVPRYVNGEPVVLTNVEFGTERVIVDSVDDDGQKTTSFDRYRISFVKYSDKEDEKYKIGPDILSLKELYLLSNSLSAIQYPISLDEESYGRIIYKARVAVAMLIDKLKKE